MIICRAIKKGLVLSFIVCLTFAGRTAFADGKGQGLVVFAAASLADVMKSITADFERQYGRRVHLNLAGSNTLRIQIENGAECDVFLSADGFNTQRLIESGFVSREKRHVLLRNSLVIVSRNKNEFAEFADLADNLNGYLSMADPSGVPAGIYSRQALVNAGLWAGLKDRIVPALDVRAALNLVKTGNADYGIVYKTDVTPQDGLTVVYNIPQELHSPIEYSAVLLKTSEGEKYSRIFYYHLQSDIAKMIYDQYGFMHYER